MSEEKDLPIEGNEGLQNVVPVSGMYQDWFLDYASYVILERAVPAIEDGFKPVQRRIMHAMKEMDDGRFNKVANIIGQSMQYHPHGDASIGDAIVNLGQKDLLIETQGNWGDVRTGDGAAAARYIEARLSKFALEVVFNPQTTEWQLSYDGRKKEPVTLPVKFPLLLAQGVEGIAVGLSTKILPHNFCELIEGSIQILKGKKTNILPDFNMGGYADFSEYNEGLRGGKVKVRAKIEEDDNRTLLIKEIPYGTTTNSLIESIIKANDKGKIKIKKVVDNTAKDVEIMVQLAPGQSPNMTIDALYAFTDCEVSISPNACVIIDDKPVFLSVNKILEYNTFQTKDLLNQELEIRKSELLEKLLFSSLEKIFIENRIYRDIEECETWEAVIETIDKGLEPFKPEFYREITKEDIIRLTEIKIKRISKFDTFKADELMRKLNEELEEVNHHLQNLTDYVIQYYSDLLKKYGKGRERKTEARTFDTIAANIVAANNAKLYVNRADGFVGYGLKKDEFVCECSDLDDIIIFRRDGVCMVTKIQDKGFVGKDIIHVAVFRKGDERMVYNLIYLDGGSGRTMIKRFQVLSVTRDREYVLTKGTKGTKVLYFTANANGEAEIVTVFLTAGAKARVKVFDFDFKDLEIKGRGAKGNILTKYPVRKIQLKMEGVSTLGGLDIYFDPSVGRLNTDERGDFVGNFLGEDKVLVFYKDGNYELTTFELTNRYEPENILLIEKYDPESVVSSIYYDGVNKMHYVKRFVIETSTLNKKFNFISDHKQSKLTVVSTEKQPQVKVKFKLDKEVEEKVYDMDMLIDVKGWKSVGNRLSNHKVINISLVESAKPEKKKENPVKNNDSEESKNGSGEDDDKEQLGLF
ncbi:DNA gyrase/topoisomerase IV subunit A [Cyclobacterium marinum]|uniref:DNA gyrase/topoisomerase IV subunit A n=1 Tax=Cyclobacterium marinum (strain ATCC 25205 / DSM 745 / LMG 13164 / NCIMB 1802) TaxID=880070 RepID=G0J697_CYCMS|nr:DNA gyrase/topoisomerase IV subunit A [Cyclobacterium marinum]AEL26849.1 DNA gyrase/topoisomerase IV subunit A [Cyclobacterium marinum DSM 745]